MSEILSEISPKYFLSILAAFFGCAAFYLLYPKKIPLSEIIKSVIVAMMMGVVALAVSNHYFKSTDEFMNFAVYPFAAGFTSPSILRGYVLILIAFSTNPFKTLEIIADLFTKIKGGKSSKGDKGKDLKDNVEADSETET